jgi:Mg2+/Co2+ transporter CorB
MIQPHHQQHSAIVVFLHLHCAGFSLSNHKMVAIAPSTTSSRMAKERKKASLIIRYLLGNEKKILPLCLIGQNFFA